MAESNVSPLGAAKFFERLGGDSEEGDTNGITGWIASHPAPGERARAYREAAKGKTFKPVLTKAEFEAIKSMCKQDPDVEEFDFF